MTSFEFLIKNNIEFIKTLFHIYENNVFIIDNNNKVIKKEIYISNIFDSIPIVKDILQDIFKEFIIIESIINEFYDTQNNQFIYKIKFNNKNINNYRVFIILAQDSIYKNKINFSIKLHNKDKNPNISNDMIIHIIINWYKANFIEKDLKTLFNKYSYELNSL